MFKVPKKRKDNIMLKKIFFFRYKGYYPNIRSYVNDLYSKLNLYFNSWLYQKFKYLHDILYIFLNCKRRNTLGTSSFLNNLFTVICREIYRNTRLYKLQKDIRKENTDTPSHLFKMNYANPEQVLPMNLEVLERSQQEFL